MKCRGYTYIWNLHLPASGVPHVSRESTDMLLVQRREHRGRRLALFGHVGDAEDAGEIRVATRSARPEHVLYEAGRHAERWRQGRAADGPHGHAGEVEQGCDATT